MKHKTLTPGERMVWAAAFVAHLPNLKYPPAHLCYPNKNKEVGEWERGQVVSAIEDAACAVQYLREALPGVREGFGDGSDSWGDTTQFLEEMIEEGTHEDG